MTANIVQSLQAFNQGREPERLALKYQRMRASSFAFLRGSCHRFYALLQAHVPLPDANCVPTAWACGDLHTENFGSYKGDDRLGYFDINDFDEAALTPVHWDALRMLTSLRLACHDFKLPGAQTTALCESFIRQYGDALTLGKSRWVERETATGPVGHLLQDLQRRKRVDLLNSRTVMVGKRRQLRLNGQKALPISDAERAAVLAFIDTFAAQQDDRDFFKVIDVARRVAGTGSLGLPRYVVLVKGKGAPDHHYLLDLKQAQPSSLSPWLHAPQPQWPTDAHRIVAVQRRFQAVSMAFMHPVTWGDHSWVLRALQPQEDRVDLARLRHDPAGFTALVTTQAQLLAWGQLRCAGWLGSATADNLSAFAAQSAWRAEVLLGSQHLADLTMADWAQFAAAFDANQLP